MKVIVERQLKKELFQVSVVKKTLVAFVFLCMLINGFTPKSAEGRDSLFIVLACTMQNAVSEVFVSCNEALTSISNKITKNIYAMLLAKDVTTTAPINKENNQEPQPINTTSDNGIITDRREDIKIGYNNIDSDNTYISYISTGKLYKLYENFKISCENNGMGILLFILFAVFIVRRKEISENIKKTGYKRLALDR